MPVFGRALVPRARVLVGFGDRVYNFWPVLKFARECAGEANFVPLCAVHFFAKTDQKFELAVQSTPENKVLTKVRGAQG